MMNPKGMQEVIISRDKAPGLINTKVAPGLPQ